MTASEFLSLNTKLEEIGKTCLETKGIVLGHSKRIEVCERDRDDLFSSRNDHLVRLTKIETKNKEKNNFMGNTKQDKTIRFDWFLRVIIAIFMGVSTIILLLRYINS
jgi:hypothetical protein|tara:strand:- start:215 stop:535 length:321 start_codon:yes stop_codon:yes gene_type:complete